MQIFPDACHSITMRRKRLIICFLFICIIASFVVYHLQFGSSLISVHTAPQMKDVNDRRFYGLVTANQILVLNQTNSTHSLPHDYKLVMNNLEACRYQNGTDKDVFLLVLVLTMHKNKKQRQVIRETWASPKEINGKKIVTMFLLGNITDQNFVKSVQAENDIHKDILMEDFIDTYTNLTLKTIMGLKWATMFCRNATYVMKTDDDMFVHYGNIIKYLSNPKENLQTKLAVGFLMKGGPIRNKKSKWYMPYELYPSNRYPPFLSGTGYVMSADVVRDTYIQSLHSTFLYLEDVFCATVWETLGIIPRKMDEFHNYRIPYSICRYRKIVTSHQLSTQQIQHIWKDLKVNPKKC